MLIITYDTTSGAIISTGNDPDGVAVDADNMMEGVADPDEQYIDLTDPDNPVIADRVHFELVSTRSEVIAGGDDQAVITLPGSCYIENSGEVLFVAETNYILTGDESRNNIRLVGKYKSNKMRVRIMPLEVMKEKANRRVERAHRELAAVGFLFQGKTYSASEESLNEIERAASYYSRKGDVPAGFFWLDIDNDEVPMTKAVLYLLADAAADHTFNANTSLKNQASAIKGATPNEMHQYDPGVAV